MNSLPPREVTAFTPSHAKSLAEQNTDFTSEGHLRQVQQGALRQHQIMRILHSPKIWSGNRIPDMVVRFGLGPTIPRSLKRPVQIATI
jgi:hypothetical protein